MPNALRRASIVGRFIPGYPTNIVILSALFAMLLSAGSVGAAPPAVAPTDGTAVPIVQLSDRFEMRSGVLVDRAGERLYLMAPDGAVEALALATGEPVWRSTEAAMPVALGKAGLLAMAEGAAEGNGLELVRLDPTSGNALSRGRHSLPTAVRAGIDDGLGSKFRLTAESGAAEGAPTTLAWSFSEKTVSGMKMPVEDSAERSLQLAGSLLVSPGTESIGIEATKAAGPSPRQAIELSGEDRLAVSEGPKARQFLSTDGRHVLVSTRMELAESATPKQRSMQRYQWAIYDRSGVRIGSTSAPTSYSPFFVAGALIVHEAGPMAWLEEGKEVEKGLRLRAVDLRGGSEMWTRDLRDTTYRGPFPP